MSTQVCRSGQERWFQTGPEADLRLGALHTSGPCGVIKKTVEQHWPMMKIGINSNGLERHHRNSKTPIPISLPASIYQKYPKLFYVIAREKVPVAELKEAYIWILKMVSQLHNLQHIWDMKNAL